jgi:hypothetical protein
VRLNSFDRFTKTSPRLLLEEHAHCEVPAGCGGVVLRWINPATGLPVLLDVFNPSHATLAIDGVAVTHSSLLLAPGRHVLSLEVPRPPADGSALLIMVARLKLAGSSLDRVIIRSAADRSWLYTTSTPPPAWTTDPTLSRRGWAPLVERPVPPIAKFTSGWYTFERATRDPQTRPLGLRPGPHPPPVRVRKVFEVPEVTPG